MLTGEGGVFTAETGCSSLANCLAVSMESWT